MPGTINLKEVRVSLRPWRRCRCGDCNLLLGVRGQVVFAVAKGMRNNVRLLAECMACVEEGVKLCEYYRELTGDRFFIPVHNSTSIFYR